MDTLNALSTDAYRAMVDSWLEAHYWNAAEPPSFSRVQSFMAYLRDSHGDMDVVQALRPLPLYQLWTAESVAIIAAWLRRRNARVVLEVGAGDGRLTAWLRPLVPAEMRLIATDDRSWVRPAARALPRTVHRLHYDQALVRFRPDTVLSSWMPYREDWTPAFRRTVSVQRYLLVGEGAWGCVGTRAAWQPQRSWRRQTLQGFTATAWCRTDCWFGPFLNQHSRAVAWTRSPGRCGGQD